MLSSDDIYALYKQRYADSLPYHSAAAHLQNVYEGKMEVPLPELDDAEATASANLVQIGADQHGMRISSVMPGLICPAVSTTKTAEKRANQRRLSIQAWWYLNKIKSQIMPKRARHLITLATSPVLIYPGKDQFPCWQVYHPLSTYPAPGNDLVPADCIYEKEEYVKTLRSRYPEYAAGLGKNEASDKKVKLLTYISDEQFSLCVIGSENHSGRDTDASYMIANVPNRAMRPLVVIPGRITLDKLLGQFDQLVGMYATQSKLWALQIHAVTREIFGETWATATAQGGTPEVIVKADPYANVIGEIKDGQLQQFRVQSSQGPVQAINNLERAQRMTGAIPAETTGESPSNVRTGRRGSQVLGSAIDFYIQEHQNLLADSLEEENKIAIAIAKNYWGNQPKTFYIPLAKGQVSYIPDKTFEIDDQYVEYPMAGTDINSLVVGAGQRIAQKSLSIESFMAMDPYVTDVDAEHDRIMREGIEQATMASILTQAQDPASPWSPAQMGRLQKLIYVDDMEIWDAIDKIEQEAKEAQAQMQQPQPDMTAMQPGMAMAGAPGTPQAGVAPPNEGQQNLSSLLMNLRRPQQGVQ